MQKLLTIDNGNTNPHVGIFKNQKFVKVVSYDDFLLESVLSQQTPGIISNVGNTKEIFSKMCAPLVDIHSLRKHNQFLGMPVNYSLTLGDDRLCQSYFVYKEHCEESSTRVLLIDSGTFTTIDLISEKGFEGGFIFPGTQTLLGSYDHGSKLSVLNANSISLSEPVHIPNDTNSAISSATQILHQALYEKLLKEFEFSKVIFTGGFGEQHREVLLSISPNIETSYEQNLIHYSLKKIYETHSNLA